MTDNAERDTNNPQWFVQGSRSRWLANWTLGALMIGGSLVIGDRVIDRESSEVQESVNGQSRKLEEIFGDLSREEVDLLLANLDRFNEFVNDLEESQTSSTTAPDNNAGNNSDGMPDVLVEPLPPIDSTTTTTTTHPS